MLSTITAEALERLLSIGYSIEQALAVIPQEQLSLSIPADCQGLHYLNTLDSKRTQVSLPTELLLRAEYFTQDPGLLAMLAKLRLVVNAKCPVLLVGPPGVGKDILARALHGNRRGTFVAVNCAELNGPLMRSELFGDAKGSFTGAAKDTDGLLLHAEDGTLFFDEIGELNMEAQSCLLRVLESRTYRQLGALDTKQTNARFVFATNAWTSAEELATKLRPDFYSRIATVLFRVPSLDHRGTPELKYLLRKFAPTITEEQLALVANHPYNWPGNVRELRAFVTRMELFGFDEALNMLGQV